MAIGSSAGERIRNVSKEVEAELVRLIAYMNDDVVPEVRRSSAIGLRSAAEQLGRLAQHLDRAAGTGSGTGGSAARSSFTSAGPGTESGAAASGRSGRSVVDAGSTA